MDFRNIMPVLAGAWMGVAAMAAHGVEPEAGENLAALDITLPQIGVTQAMDMAARYATPQSTAVTRFQADNLIVPQSSQSINWAQIQDSGSIDMADVLKSVPSAYSGHSRTAPFASFSWKL